MYNENVAVYYGNFEDVQEIVNETIGLIDKVEDGRIELTYPEYRTQLLDAVDYAIHKLQMAKEEIK